MVYSRIEAENETVGIPVGIIYCLGGPKNHIIWFLFSITTMIYKHKLNMYLYICHIMYVLRVQGMRKRRDSKSCDPLLFHHLKNILFKNHPINFSHHFTAYWKNMKMSVRWTFSYFFSRVFYYRRTIKMHQWYICNFHMKFRTSTMENCHFNNF